MAYKLYPTQHTMLGFQHGEIAVRDSSVQTRGRFHRQALKIEKESDRANYLTALASMTADGIGSSWASFYELCCEIEESGIWRHLEPKEGEPPKSYNEWRDVVFKEKIVDWVTLEATYLVIKKHYPDELRALNLDEAVARIEKIKQEHDQIRSMYEAKDQQNLDLFAERMPEEKREELQERIDAGKRVTQADVAAAAGVDQRTVSHHVGKNGQLTGTTNDLPKSTRDTRRYEKLSAIPGMTERIEAGESMRKLAVEAGIEKPQLCLPRTPSKAVASILRDFGDDPDWLLAVTKQLTHHLTENHANATEAEEPGADPGF